MSSAVRRLVKERRSHQIWSVSVKCGNCAFSNLVRFKWESRPPVHGHSQISLMSFAATAHSLKVPVSHRWFGKSVRVWYIEGAINSYIDGHPSTFIVDSSSVHLSDLPVWV